MINFIKHIWSHKIVCPLFRHGKFINYAKTKNYHTIACGLCGKEFKINYLKQ